MAGPIEFRNIFVYPKYPENLTKLYALAYNLWATWNYEVINLFYRIDPALFREVNHNPVNFLIHLPKERIEALSKDRGFLFEMEKAWDKFQQYLAVPSDACATDQQPRLSPKDAVAYFVMEFGVHESIPSYGGGLGILSGDFLKGASDMGLPIIGVGLLYKYGYFTQRINLDGYQEEMFDTTEKYLLPIRQSRDQQGKPLTVSVRILDQQVTVHIWEMEVGRTRALLLDTDTEENPPYLRDITYELYVSDHEKRIQQELVLGIGGMRALEAKGMTPAIYHLNEGHSAFLILARLHALMRGKGFSFSEARAVIRRSTVFTTHTPIIAGNENFPTPLVKKYLEREIAELGISFEEFARHGFVDGRADTFWMPSFSIRFSRAVNAVSLLHRDVSRKMWSPLFPRRELSEIPIDHVTNGIHISWLSEPFTQLFNRYLGQEYIYCGDRKDIWDRVFEIPDGEIWDAHRKNKQNLVAFARRNLTETQASRGFSQAKIQKLMRALNPEYLSIGFAKRIVSYKRPYLIFKDKERLMRLLTNSARPVQLIFAGKAHPADEPAKNMIRDVIAFARENNVEDRVIFLENYDVNVARHLTCGVDVWLNNPVMYMEASGTSGMKASINGVLHLSVPDGWWHEGFNGGNGWSINAGETYVNPEIRDAAEANQLYNFLEEEITEIYYDKNDAGVPEEWVRRMKNAITSVGAQFTMNRVIGNYVTRLYLPCRKESEELAAGDYALLREAKAQEQKILALWDTVRILSFTTSVDTRDHLIEGEPVEAQCAVRVGDLDPALLAVEIYYRYDHLARILPMTFAGAENGEARYTASYPTEGYGVQSLNVRVRPANPVIADLYPECITWKE